MEYYGDELDGKLPCEFDEAVTGIKRRARGESAVRGGGGGSGGGGGGARRVEPASRNNLKSEYQERVDTTSCTNCAHQPCFHGRAEEAGTQREGEVMMYT